MENIPWTITDEELRIAEQSLILAKKAGADHVRITVNKSLMDLFSMLNGELDKVTHSGDRSLTFSLFVDGRYGTCSTNKFDLVEIEKFLAKAVGTIRMLAPDQFRRLPDPSLTAKDAITGFELEMYDPEYAKMDSSKRLSLAKKATFFGKWKKDGDYDLISEEVEYSDSISDLIVLDTNGLRCRHIESSFGIGCETTVKDREGNKLSGYWWDATSALKDLKLEDCCPKALERAISHIGPQPRESGKYNMVVESEVAARLVNPILNALGAFAIQQKNSFLVDSLGKRLFPEGMNLIDKPRMKGSYGTRYFDSEGLATYDAPIIENGVVKEWFVSTYMAGKMGIKPTVDGATKPILMKFWDGPEENVGLEEILKRCGKGILVTDFNGGNNNGASGDFSYGVEGFWFENGEICEPIEGMVITGNFLTLWNNLIAAGTDSRDCRSKVVPTIAFKDVDFSG